MKPRTAAVSVIFALALIAVPVAAEAQQARKVSRVGVLVLGPAGANAPDLAAFLERMNQLGYVEGQNLQIESRFADREMDRLPRLAADLVRINVDVIVTITTPAAQAAKAATATIPIVMAGSADPVDLGLVASLAHPGGT
jgi:putative ABC transport system substrate-binding protein